MIIIENRRWKCSRSWGGYKVHLTENCSDLVHALCPDLIGDHEVDRFKPGNCSIYDNAVI